jgi:hypothetical protein
VLYGILVSAATDVSTDDCVNEVKPMRCSIRCGLLIILGILVGFGAVRLNDGAGREKAKPAELPAEVLADWRAQDGIDQGRTYKDAVAAIVDELKADAAKLRPRIAQLEGIATDDAAWQRLYHDACLMRRTSRLRALLKNAPRIVFTRHYDIGGSHYAYTEGQSDAQNERVFVSGASLCLLSMNGLFGDVRTLVDDPNGVVRDPDVSYDGRRVLFAWKKSLDNDDYHLYELDAASGSVRQLTSGLGFADYEGIYAPNGQIIFSSTRCVQTVDCWWTEVSNLYTCDGDGRYLRRLGFDQVHTNYPTAMPDGRILYTRWEYSDRGQIYPQGLFEMNPDGTKQAEFYGNNSFFPTSLLHARGIPGSGKVVAIFGGHHALQQGWLGIVDPRRGRQENQGTQLIAPVRETEAVHVDAYGQSGHQFQYPYPLSETEFIVAFRPEGAKKTDGSPAAFGIYWIDRDGRRELLASHPQISCNQPVPLVARPMPRLRPSPVDYRKKTALCYVQDVYAGPGLAGVPRGTIKKLRIVALDYRAAGIGSTENKGSAGDATVSTPISTGNGTWDPKIVLGEATVHKDGSASFEVPARTPLYFQAIDRKGHAVQTMRSWTTLQPGETASCVGCHEDKNSAPPVRGAVVSSALSHGVERLQGFYGPPRGFSFRREIQPILDRHCTECHKVPPSEKSESSTVKRLQSGKLGDRAFSLLGTEVLDSASKRKWSQSYLTLTDSRIEAGLWQKPVCWANPQGKFVNWINAQSEPPMLPPYTAGAAKSRLIAVLEQGHGDVKLSREEMDKIACWIDLLVPFCGDYFEANAWSEEEMQKYMRFLGKRKRMEEIERRNIEELIRSQAK